MIRKLLGPLAWAGGAWLLGSLFTVAGAAKLAAPHDFSRVVISYRVLPPPGAGPPL